MYNINVICDYLFAQFDAIFYTFSDFAYMEKVQNSELNN